MATIKDGYYPYKEFKYDEDQDAYELMSKWTSSDTVYMPDGTTNLTTKLSSLDTAIDGIVDDTTTTTTTTWSSTKISNELDTLTEAIENVKIKYQVVPAYGTLIVDMFEGFFSLARSSYVVAGVMTRWAGLSGQTISFITEPIQQLTVSIIVDGGVDKVKFTNNLDANALVMYVDNGHEFI